MLSKFRQTIIQAAGRQPDDPDTRKAKTGGWKLAKVFGKAGSPGRNRTGTPVKEPDFESGASTSSATPARASAVYQKFLWRRV